MILDRRRPQDRPCAATRNGHAFASRLVRSLVGATGVTIATIAAIATCTTDRIEESRDPHDVSVGSPRDHDASSRLTDDGRRP